MLCYVSIHWRLIEGCCWYSSSIFYIYCLSIFIFFIWWYFSFRPHTVVPFSKSWTSYRFISLHLLTCSPWSSLYIFNSSSSTSLYLSFYFYFAPYFFTSTNFLLCQSYTHYFSYSWYYNYTLMASPYYVSKTLFFFPRFFFVAHASQLSLTTWMFYTRLFILV